MGTRKRDAPQRPRLLDLLDQTRRLHLVDDLLLRFRLLDEVGVRTSRRNEFLDVRDFLLLLVVRLHLVDLVLGLRLDVGAVRRESARREVK